MMKCGVYDTHAEERAWWFRGRRHLLERLFNRYAGPGGFRILDVGCGSGGNLSLLARYGDVIGLDVDPLAVEKARALGYDVRQADIRDCYGFSSDVIVALDILEHIDDDMTALNRIHGLLSPGGCFILSVPAMPSLWSLHDVVMGHVRRYTARELRGKLAAAGFVVSYLTAFGLTVLPAQYAVRRLFKHVNGANDVPGILGWLLRTALWLECLMLPPVSLPLGPTLVAVATRKAA